MSTIITENFGFGIGSGGLSTRAGWARPRGLENLFHDSGSLLQSADNYDQTAYYLHSTMLPSANYAVDSVVRWHANGAGGSVGVLARATPDGMTGYRLRLADSFASPQITLHRSNAGVLTLLGAYTAFTSSNGVPNIMRLAVEDNRIRAYRNGVLVIDVTDTTPIAAAGQTGIVSYRYAATATRFRIFNFEATTFGDPEPARRGLKCPLMLVPR